MSTVRDERGLAEIRALAQRRGEDVDEVLKRIGEARNELGSEGQVGGRPAVNNQQREPLIAFVHIPKTAGGTVTSMFAGTFSRAAVKGAGNYLRSPDKTGAKVSRIRVAGARVTVGPIPYGLLRQHLPADTRYLTFLREPVDRLLSHYYRHVHRPDISPEDRRDLERRGKPTAASIEEALGMGLPQLSNVATRLLCDDPAPPADLPEGALEEAKRNLSRFAFVGIQERFDESIVLLQRRFGLDLNPSADRHVSVDRPSVEQIPDGQRALIIDSNRLDMELYGFGRELFEEAVAAVDDDEFRADVETLRTMSAAAKVEFETRTQRACDWLDGELPFGTSRPLADLRVAGEEAGISFATLKRAKKLLGAVKELDPEGRLMLRREPEPSVGSDI